MHGQRFIALSLFLLMFVLLVTTFAASAEKHAATGLLVSDDPAHKTIIVSCREIPGYMEAMQMPFLVRDAKSIERLTPGTMLDFDLVEDQGKPYAENIRVHPFQSMELDPTAARRLRAVENAMSSSAATKPVAVGEHVPDFTLTDQLNHPVRLSEFDGKVVAITFMYTRCPFPTYCVRLSDNFARLQKRFRDRVGRDLILLNVVIDSGHDQPIVLESYARKWNADPQGWRFLTGSLTQIQEVCRYFDMNYYPDEGLYIHSFHTAVLDRQQKLVANLEGNEFTANQLGDLVNRVLAH